MDSRVIPALRSYMLVEAGHAFHSGLPRRGDTSGHVIYCVYEINRGPLLRRSTKARGRSLL